MLGNVLVALIGLTCGITARSLFDFPWQIIALSALLSFFFIFFWFLRRRFLYLLPALFLFTAVVGAERVNLVPRQLPETFRPSLESYVSYEGTIVQDPDRRETTQRVTVEVEEEGTTARFLAVAPLYPDVQYGERVQIEGTLKEPEPFETDGGRVFRYDRFLAKDGVFALIDTASLTKLAPRSNAATQVMGFLFEGKHAFEDALARALPEPGSSLAIGLIVGGKQGLGKELLDAFTITGLLPIVVLSGYNVMIIAEAILRSLSFLPRRIATTVATITITLFVLVAGAGSSAVRAGFMAGIALFARGSGRTYDALRALLVVFVLMLLINPLLLVYDPGFQFSCVATLGLIVGSAPVAMRLTGIPNAFMREILASTIAAQVAVLPLLLYHTGNLSLVALPANVLVLPIVPIAMFLSFVAGVVGLLVPAVAPYAGLPAHVALSYIIEVAHLLSQLPFAQIVMPSFPFIFVLAAYALLAAILWRIKTKTA